MEYYSARERNEVLITCQTQKATYSMFPFIGKIQKRQIHRDKKHISG